LKYAEEDFARSVLSV
jgi:hypothetical protein